MVALLYTKDIRQKRRFSKNCFDFSSKDYERSRMAQRAYKILGGQRITWYPGHMNKSFRQMQQRLKIVDCVIEVHDARIPFSGRNPEFRHVLTNGGVKPHIMVLNKMDLTDKREQSNIVRQLRERESVQNTVFTNSKDQQCNGIKRLLPLVQELISTSDRYNRTGEKDFAVMVIGVPNVGKSSLLNVLRNRNLRKKSATAVGAVAGVTRSMMEKIKINEDPLTYMIDTPGILEPRISDDEMGLKLALVGCLPDHIVGEDIIADYLLYWMNKHGRQEYLPALNLKQPTDQIMEALISCANHLGAVRKHKNFNGQIVLLPDYMHAAKHFIRLFRRGDLGPANLDQRVKK